MAFKSPTPAVVLNALRSGKTYLAVNIPDDVDPPTSILIEDMNSVVASRFTFTGSLVPVFHQSRHLLKITCTGPDPLPNVLPEFTNLKISFSKPANNGTIITDSETFPVMLKTRGTPTLDHSRLPKVSLVFATGAETNIILPGRNFAPVGELFNLEVEASRGKWSGTAIQREKFLNVTLRCSSLTEIMVLDSNDPFANLIAITLRPHDGNSYVVPLLNVVYLSIESETYP